MLMPSIIGAEWNREGVTREVILTRHYAIKFPSMFRGWKMFLCGLLANMQEREFSRAEWPELCPVVFSLPGGWIVVMRRAEPLTDAEWSSFDEAWYWKFCEPADYHVPVEQKQSSFGKLDGKIVAVDYGN